MKWIACLILAFFATTAMADASYRHLKIKYDMWLVVCAYSQYTCKGVPLPTVKYEKMSSRLHGYYRGGNTVYVSNKLYGLKRRATVLHEMSHYLDVVQGGMRVPGKAYFICKSEATAFALVDRWYRSIGRKSLQRGPNWWKVYPHCQKWYNPNYHAKGYGWW